MAELPAGATRDLLLAARFALAVPLAAGERASGLLLVGERPAGRAYETEEIDFAAALARQVQAALEAARLHRLRIEKERQDRDLQIAREIQQTLFPRSLPRVEGFDLAAVSRSCYQVGGDYYDVIPLAGGRLALVVGDVSGKGTPASLMMASVHASMQAMAGTAHADGAAAAAEPLPLRQHAVEPLRDPASTRELDAPRRRLTYVNAGHVPPYLVRAGGERERLRAGGPVVGLLEEVAFETGELPLAPGDLLAVVTDGVTEALGRAGRRIRRRAGDRGAGRRVRGREPQRPLQALLIAVDAWTGAAGCTDDLTVLTLRAT